MKGGDSIQMSSQPGGTSQTGEEYVGESQAECPILVLKLSSLPCEAPLFNRSTAKNKPIDNRVVMLDPPS